MDGAAVQFSDIFASLVAVRNRHVQIENHQIEILCWIMMGLEDLFVGHVSIVGRHNVEGLKSLEQVFKNKNLDLLIVDD